MTEAARLHDELLEAFKHYSFTPGDPLTNLLPKVCDALAELDQRQQEQPAFIAIPRVK